MIFGKKEVQRTVENLLKEKKCKDTEEEYLSCVEMLQSIYRTGEIKSAELRDIVAEAIYSFTSHANLGIIIKGEFNPIDCHIAARHDIVVGNFISGKRFPVMKEDEAKEILSGPLTANLPSDCMWDAETQTILHARSYYLRHLDELIGIRIEEVERLRLSDVFRQTLSEIG